MIFPDFNGNGEFDAFDVLILDEILKDEDEDEGEDEGD